MKICPNCRASYADDSLRFCLQCGTPLPAEKANSKGNGGLIAAAILGGFLLLVLVVGGVGVLLFSRQNAVVTPVNNGNQTAADANGNSVSANLKTFPVEQINGSSARLNSNSVGVNSNSNSPPRIIASSSSARRPNAGNYYFPNFAFDKNPATAWCEGAAGAGVGEWVQFDFGREINLRGLKIAPGYFKNQDAWRKNNRVAGIAVQYSNNATSGEFRFADKMENQTIDLGSVRTSSVRIKITDFYRGDADGEDTLISEVSFITEP